MMTSIGNSFFSAKSRNSSGNDYELNLNPQSQNPTQQSRGTRTCVKWNTNKAICYKKVTIFSSCPYLLKEQTKKVKNDD
jgi:hypothetical protein